MESKIILQNNEIWARLGNKKGASKGTALIIWERSDFSEVMSLGVINSCKAWEGTMRLLVIAEPDKEIKIKRMLLKACPCIAP